MEKFVGKWIETHREGFEEFAEAVEMGDRQKVIYEGSTTDLEYQLDGGQWTLVFGVSGMLVVKHIYDIQLGVAQETTDINGLPMTSLINIEGERFVESHRFQKWGGIDVSIVREIHGSTMTVTSSYNGCAMKTFYDPA